MTNKNQVRSPEAGFGAVEGPPSPPAAKVENLAELKAPKRADLEVFAQKGWLDKNIVFAYKHQNEAGFVFYTKHLYREWMEQELRRQQFSFRIEKINETEYAIYIPEPKFRGRREAEDWYKLHEARLGAPTPESATQQSPGQSAEATAPLVSEPAPEAPDRAEDNKVVIQKITPSQMFERLGFNFKNARPERIDEAAEILEGGVNQLRQNVRKITQGEKINKTNV